MSELASDDKARDEWLHRRGQRIKATKIQTGTSINNPTNGDEILKDKIVVIWIKLIIYLNMSKTDLVLIKMIDYLVDTRYQLWTLSALIANVCNKLNEIATDLPWNSVLLKILYKLVVFVFDTGCLLKDFNCRHVIQDAGWNMHLDRCFSAGKTRWVGNTLLLERYGKYLLK